MAARPYRHHERSIATFQVEYQSTLIELSSLFYPGETRPLVQAMIAFIDGHGEAYGVEPICKVLATVPSTYLDHVA
jgi:hypothetical protein